MREIFKLKEENQMVSDLWVSKDANLLERKKAYPYFGFVDIRPPMGDKFVLFCANDCPTSLSVLHNGVISDERNSIKFWLVFAQSSRVILDIGSHIGLFSFLAASVNPKALVYAFEPNPIVYSRLAINVHSNRVSNIKPIFSPVSSEESDIEIHFSPNTSWLSPPS
jgi:hypothetical protein